MDMFVVPTISFRLLYGLLIVGHELACFLKHREVRDLNGTCAN